VDEAYVGRSAPGEALYWQAPAAGDYRLRVVDDHGRSDARPLELMLVN
jgi:penicillin-binding protein 1C